MKVPLGTIVNVKAEIAKANPYSLNYRGEFILRITEINHFPLSKTIEIPFESWSAYLPASLDGLARFMYLKQVEDLTQIEYELMMSKYIGKRFELFVFEQGGFHGLPKDLNRYQYSRSGGDFAFRSYVVVVKDVTKHNGDWNFAE